jgi:hypothetical protein
MKEREIVVSDLQKNGYKPNTASDPSGVANCNGMTGYMKATGRLMAIKSTYFMHKQIHLQTCLIDGRHFSDVINVMERREANIDSDHMLVVIKLRARIFRGSNTKPQQLRRFAVDGLKDRDVTSRWFHELESDLQGVQAQPLNLDEKCKKLEETIQRVATNTVGYTRKQANKEWFDQECAKKNEEKIAAREWATHNNTRGAKNAYKLARTQETRLFRKKARQLNEEALIEIERHRSIQDSRKFYKRLNDDRSNHKWICDESRTGNY